jgi:hypothetical protein
MTLVNEVRVLTLLLHKFGYFKSCFTCRILQKVQLKDTTHTILTSFMPWSTGDLGNLEGAEGTILEAALLLGDLQEVSVQAEEEEAAAEEMGLQFAVVQEEVSTLENQF